MEYAAADDLFPEKATGGAIAGAAATDVIRTDAGLVAICRRSVARLPVA